MAIRQYRPMAPSNFSTASAIKSKAEESFNKGFESLKGILSQFQQAQKQKIDMETAVNTQNIQANLKKLNSLRALRNAENTGSFDPLNLSKQFNGRVDSTKVQGAVEATKNRLKQEAINRGSNKAYEIAKESGSITAGFAPMRDYLISEEGLTASEANQAVASWGEQAKPLQAEIDAKNMSQLASAISAADTLVKQGATMSEAINNVSDQLLTNSPAIKESFINQYRDRYEKLTSLTNEQKDQLAAIEERNNLKISGIEARNQAIIQKYDNQISAIGAPYSKETESRFADATQDSIREFLGKKAASGRFDDIDQIEEDINSKFKELHSLKDKQGNPISLTDAEISAMMATAYEATFEQGWGNDWNKPEWSADIDRRVAKLQRIKQLQKVKSEKQAEMNKQIADLKLKSFNNINRFKTDLRSSNITGSKVTPNNINAEPLTYTAPSTLDDLFGSLSKQDRSAIKQAGARSIKANKTVVQPTTPKKSKVKKVKVTATEQEQANKAYTLAKNNPRISLNQTKEEFTQNYLKAKQRISKDRIKKLKDQLQAAKKRKFVPTMSDSDLQNLYEEGDISKTGESLAKFKQRYRTAEKSSYNKKTKQLIDSLQRKLSK